MANKITVPLRGGRFEGTTFTFTQKRTGTIRVSWSGQPDGEIVIRQVKSKSVMLEDGTRISCTPGDFVAFNFEGGVNRGAMFAATTAKRAFVDSYDIVW